jgi:hypothetical protein
VTTIVMDFPYSERGEVPHEMSTPNGGRPNAAGCTRNASNSVAALLYKATLLYPAGHDDTVGSGIAGGNQVGYANGSPLAWLGQQSSLRAVNPEFVATVRGENFR